MIIPEVTSPDGPIKRLPTFGIPMLQLCVVTINLELATLEEDTGIKIKLTRKVFTKLKSP